MPPRYKVKSAEQRVQYYIIGYHVISYLFAILFYMVVGLLLNKLVSSNRLLVLFSFLVSGIVGAQVFSNAVLTNIGYELEEDLQKGKSKYLYLISAAIVLIPSLITFGWFSLVIAPVISLFACCIIVSKYTKKPVIDETVHKNHPIEEQPYEPDFEREDLPTAGVMKTGDRHDPNAPTYHGNAEWMADDRKSVESEVLDGLWLGGGFLHHKEGNLLSVAPPGTGKGAALIIPNLLLKRYYDHSFVVFDPKGTNACITARFQKEQGRKVIIIDPMNLQKMNNAIHGIAPSSFNPLDFIKDDVFNGSSQIANLFLPDNPKSTDRFWDQEARSLIQVVIIYITLSKNIDDKDRNLVSLFKLLVGDKLKDVFIDIIRDNDFSDDIGAIVTGYLNTSEKSEKTFATIKSIANSAVKWLGNPTIQDCLKTSDFNPSELAEGNTTLYLCQPIQNKEGFATFSRLIIGFCLRANSMPSPKPKNWVYYLLDEYPTMGIFPEVVQALAYSREYKMRIWIFAQSLSQLDTIYKVEGRNEILGSCNVLQAFGVTDQVTQKYISERIGNKTETVYTESHMHGSNSGSSQNFGNGSSGSGSSEGSSSSRTGNTAYIAKPLISPTDLQYDPHIITLIEAGPMRLVRWQYWHDEIPGAKYYSFQFKKNADPNPNFN